jgi:hypothetical protein
VSAPRRPTSRQGRRRRDPPYGTLKFVGDDVCGLPIETGLKADRLAGVLVNAARLHRNTKQLPYTPGPLPGGASDRYK